MKTTLTKLTHDLQKAGNIHIRTGDDGRQRLVIEKDGRFFEIADPIPTDEELAASVAAFEREHLGDAA